MVVHVTMLVVMFIYLFKGYEMGNIGLHFPNRYVIGPRHIVGDLMSIYVHIYCDRMWVVCALHLYWFQVDISRCMVSPCPI